MENDKTLVMDKVRQPEDVKEIMSIVFEALDSRDYNAIDQIVGYMLSGDPSYITSHSNARTLITKIDREDILEELIRTYLNK